MATVDRFEAGPASEWDRWLFQHPLSSRPAPGKLFLSDKLNLTGMEISLNTLPPGKGPPFVHRHRTHEEVYVFLSGTGEFQVDGKRFPVSAGSAVRVSPEGERTWRNTGTEPLTYIVIQAVAGSLQEQGIDDGEVVARQVIW